MIQVSISEIKNRLSYYLRLVRGGEQIEILDRKTPLARIIHVSQIKNAGKEAPWIKEVVQLGLVSPPQKGWKPGEMMSKESLVLHNKKIKPEVLKALLEERNEGI